MSDKEFLEAIKCCRNLIAQHKKLSKIVFDEYKKRYGCDASDTDNDEFLDVVVFGNGTFHSIKEVEETAWLHNKLRTPRFHTS